MKKTFIILSLLGALACDTKNLEIQKVASDVLVSDDYSEDYKLGRIIYDHITMYSRNIDLYSYVDSETGARLKIAFDSLQQNNISTPDKIWNDKSARGSVAMNSMKRFYQEYRQYAEQTSELNTIQLETWFIQQEDNTKSRDDLTIDQKHSLLKYQIVMHFALKAYLDGIPAPVNSSNGRQLASCSIKGDCVGANVATYAGLGALIAEPIGGAIGALFGALVSIKTCRDCPDQSTCYYPHYVSTDPVCYNPSYGLDFQLADYGNTSNGFGLEVWDNPDRSGLPLLNPRVISDKIHINNASLNGNTVIYVRPITNCGGGTEQMAPSLVRIDLTELGRPNIIINGPTNGLANNYSVFSVSGRIPGQQYGPITWYVRSLDSYPVTWSILPPSDSQLFIRWNNVPSNVPSSRVEISASASSPCGQVGAAATSIVVTNN